MVLESMVLGSMAVCRVEPDGVLSLRIREPTEAGPGRSGRSLLGERPEKAEVGLKERLEDHHCRETRVKATRTLPWGYPGGT